jgi:uncharacterized membrane protein
MLRFLPFFVLFLCAATGVSAAADNTGTALTTPTTATLGAPATLTATVTDNDNPAQPTGTVTFLDNNVPIGTALLAGATPSSSTASFSTSVLAVGSHTITASYVSDSATFAGSTAASVTQVINHRPTSVNITLNQPTITVRGSSSVTFTITDNPPANASAGTSTAAANALTTARSGHAAALLLNGKVFVVGGLDGAATPLTSAELFDPGNDPTNGTFSSAGNLNVARTGATATLLQDGTVLILGGNSTGAAPGALNTAEIFDPVAGTYTNVVATMGTKRWGHTATLLADGTVFIAGGQDDTGTALKSTEVFTPGATPATTGAFAAGVPTLLQARFEHTASLLPNGKILVAGGDTNGDAELVDPTSATPTATGSLNSARSGHSAAVLPDGIVLIAGGSVTGTAVDTLELYDSVAGTFAAVNHASPRFLTSPRTGATATLLNSAFVFVVGGINAAPMTVGSAENYVPSFDPQGTTSLTSNGPDTFSGCTPALTGTGVVTCDGSVTATHVGSGTHDISGHYTAAPANHSNSDTAASSALTVNKQAITVTAQTNTKTYDGTTTAAAVPTVNPALLGADTPNFVEVYDTRNAGTAKTLTPSGTVNDGDGGNDYSYTFVNDTTGVINQLALTVTAQTNTKTYDGTTSAGAIPTFAPALGTGDTANFTEVYGNRNAGSGKTLIPSGTVTDGNGGNNYAYTFVNDTTGVINQLALTVTAQTNTKTYDGTISAAAIPTFAPALGTGDTANFIEVYGNRNAGVGNKTLIPSGTVNDGNSGNNYSYTYVNFTTGTINQLALTVTAVTNTKTYDGTTTAATLPIFAPALGTGDTANFTEAYGNRNAGSGKTLIPSGAVSDGNGGANYTYTFVNNTTGVINQLALTVTAQTNTKTYDGMTSAAAAPTFAPALGTGDTANFTEVYSNRNAGVGNKTLIPSGTVTDGNGGANYTYTYVNFTTGTINQLALTVTAVTNTKTYDGTTTAAAVPTVAPALVGGDTPNFIEAYSNRNAGVGNKTLIPSGTVNDGNGGANYSNTFVNFTTGTINQLPLTVSAVTNTKTYDGTNSAAAVPTFAPALVGGDTPAFTEAYSNRNAGIGNKTLIPSGTVNDGNSGNNYSYTYVNFTTGTINQLALTVTAVTNTKTYDGTTTAAAVPIFAPALGTGDTANFTEVYNNRNAGVGNKTLIPSGTVTDGNGGANYSYTYVNFTTGIINPLALTVTAVTNTKIYDATTSASGIPMFAPALIAPDSAGFTEAYSTKDAGAGNKTLIPSGTVNDGNGGNNYSYTYVNFTTGTIAPKGLTEGGLSAAASKVYDGTTNAAVSGTATLQAVELPGAGTTADGKPYFGDAVSITGTATGTYNTKDVTTANSVTFGGLALTGSEAGDYTLTIQSPQAAMITTAALTITANSRSKTYGQTVTFLGTEFTANGLVSGETVASVTLTSSGAGAGAAVGSFNIVPSAAVFGVGIASNYNITLSNGTLTINPEPLTITANSTSKVYGQTVTFAGTEFTTNGLVNGETIGSVTLASAGAGPTANAGTYNIVPSAPVFNSGTAGNYSITLTNGTLTVNTAPLTVTANNKNRLYGAANPVLDGTLMGVTAGDTITASFSTTAVATTGVGAVPIIASLNDPGGRLTNYSVTNNSGTLTIDKAHLTVTANNQTRTYGAANPSNTFTLSGFQNGENPVSANVAGSPTLSTGAAATSTVAGSPYTITVVDAGTLTAPNYDFTATFVSGQLTITPAHLIVTADPQARVYGGANPTLTATVSNFVNGENLASGGVTGLANCTTPAGVTSTVAGGPYTITCTNGTLAASNYDFPALNFVTGNLTLTQAPLSITANNKTRLYGDPNPLLDGILVGVTAGDNITSSFSTTAVATTGIGTVPITATLNDPGSRLANYSVTNNSGTLTINRAHLTVMAVNQTRLYGSANGNTSFNLVGFQNGENQISANVTGSATLNNATSPTTAVGTYAISVVDAGNLSAPNYDFLMSNFANGVLTITPAHLMVTADSQARVYGGANPTLTATITGFVNGESLGTSGVAGQAQCATPAVVTSIVASYPITCTQNTLAAGNYDFPAANFLAGSLIINQAGLTVTANNKIRTYGAANPTLDGSLVGITAGDNITASFSTAATPATAIGTFVINAALNDPGNRLGNYSVTNNPGTLTINPAPLTVTANNAGKIFGQTTNFVGTEFTTSGLLNADQVNSASLASAGATAGSNVGTYPIVITAPVGIGLTNYNPTTLVNSTLTVSAATSASKVTVPFTPGANAAKYTFSATVSPQFSGTPTGTVTFMDKGAALAGGDGGQSSTVTLVNGVATFTTTVGQLAPGQSHTITAVYNKDTNFAATTSQVGASVFIAAAITTSSGAAIPAQTLQIGNPTNQDVTYTNLQCAVLTSLGTTVQSTACTVSPSASLLVPKNGSANASVQIATSNGSSAQPAPSSGALHMQVFGTLSLALPAVVFLPLAIPASTRKKLLRRKALTCIGILLLLAFAVASMGCGGGGFNNKGLQPGSVITNATPVGNYTVQVTATSSATGQPTALGSIPMTVSF